MKKAKVTSLVLIISVLILELLPYGAVCRFMGDPEAGIVIRYTYSYFDLTPFGYANFGPFLTAVLTCITTILIIMSLFTKFDLNKHIFIASVISFATSLMPLIFGFDYYSLVGFFITVLFAVIAVYHFCLSKNSK